MPVVGRGYPILDQELRSYNTETRRGYGLDTFSGGQWTRRVIQK